MDHQETVDDCVAEPVVYMIDRYVVGGFYRVNEARGIDENLNAPGMQFRQELGVQGCRLGMLAADLVHLRVENLPGSMFCLGPQAGADAAGHGFRHPAHHRRAQARGDLLDE